MAARRSKFTELANCMIGPKRAVVISKLDDGSYTIGQQMEIEEGSMTTTIFLKGALHVTGIDGLQNLRDALTLAFENELKALK